MGIDVFYFKWQNDTCRITDSLNRPYSRAYKCSMSVNAHLKKHNIVRASVTHETGRLTVFNRSRSSSERGHFDHYFHALAVYIMHLKSQIRPHYPAARYPLVLAFRLDQAITKQVKSALKRLIVRDPHRVSMISFLVSWIYLGHWHKLTN